MKATFYIGIIISTSLFLISNCFGQEIVHEQTKFERKELQKSSHVVNQPEYVDRTEEYGKKYSPKPRVVEVDPKTGKYEYRWKGFDGKEKIVTYQRADSIEAIAIAHVQKDPEGNYIYRYRVDILASSPINFRNFIVQTHGASMDNSALNNDNFLVGEMYTVGYFKDGIWKNWAYVGPVQARIVSGSFIEFQLLSKNPPGIVSCRAAGGEFGSIAADEEMPPELEDMMPVNDDLATGYTIGPDERLLKFSDSEKLKYLQDNLPKFLEAGWMSEGTMKNYEQILAKSDLKQVLLKAKEDLEKKFIAPEVYQIIEGMTK